MKMLKLFLLLSAIVAAPLAHAEDLLPLPDNVSIMNLGPISEEDFGPASILSLTSTVCREVNGKLFCYDDETGTNTTCRTVNGTVYCD